MTRLILLSLLALAALPSAAAAADRPAVCSAAAIQQRLIDRGVLTEEDVGFGEVVDLVRCGDITADGHADALFTVASGGTAGDTRFGVIHGRADGSPGALLLYRHGYDIGIARRSSRAFEVLQPIYRVGDANCCPSAFRLQRYRWNGSRFKTVGRAKRLRHAPRRFYRP